MRYTTAITGRTDFPGILARDSPTATEALPGGRGLFIKSARGASKRVRCVPQSAVNRKRLAPVAARRRAGNVPQSSGDLRSPPSIAGRRISAHTGLGPVSIGRGTAILGDLFKAAVYHGKRPELARARQFSHSVPESVARPEAGRRDRLAVPIARWFAIRVLLPDRSPFP